jgi:uracil-DNA glycosylase family 4
MFFRLGKSLMTTADESYERMLQAFALTKNFLLQQVELGFDEVYTQAKSKKRTAIKTPEVISPHALVDFYHRIKNCTKCRLAQSRNKFVFGSGNPNADLMLVGEGPGREEDLQGKPFVGAAGHLLDKMLAAIHFNRDEIFITNMVKCRPPENRDPLPDEIETCKPYLFEQIRLIRPKIILALGRVAGQALLETKSTLGQLRGRVHDWKGIKLMVTYHPAALLRYQQYKKPTWEDLQLLEKEYHKLVR